MTEFSIVIITLNEEDYLQDCLDSIDKQDFQDYEVIISDAKSEDNTREIARSYGAQIVESERKGPGHGRNKGAEAAKGDIILFLDADSKLRGNKVLDKVKNSLKNSKNVVGTSTSLVYGETLRGKLFFGIGSLYMRLVNWTGKIVMAPGSFQFIESDIFEKIGGYNEDLPFYEDEDMVQRAMEHGNLVTLSRRYYMSSRRVDEKGLWQTILDYYPPQVYRFLGKEDEMMDKYSFETTG